MKKEYVYELLNLVDEINERGGNLVFHYTKWGVDVYDANNNCKPIVLEKLECGVDSSKIYFEAFFDQYRDDLIVKTREALQTILKELMEEN